MSQTRWKISFSKLYPDLPGADELTHWGRGNIDAVSQTTFSNAFFFNENCCILIEISLKYARKVPIDNNPALVKIMAWRRPGDKPLSEPMMCSLPTHICVTRPQWVNGRMCPSSPAYIIGRLEFVDCDTGTYFTDDFSIKIQIRWKFQFVQILIKWWLQNFAHDTTTILSLHLQKMLRSDDQELNYIKTTLPSGLTYERKIISGMGLRIQVQIQVMGDNMILVNLKLDWAGLRKEREVRGRFSHYVVPYFWTSVQTQLEAFSAASWSCWMVFRQALRIDLSLAWSEDVVWPMKPRHKEPLWASLDMPALNLHIPCAYSHIGVSSSRRPVQLSPPRCSQTMMTHLSRIIWQCLVVVGYVQCIMESGEILLCQLPSSSLLRLR